MKTLYIFLLTILIYNTQAQVTLTLSANGISPGANTNVYSADTSNYSPGSSGPSQNWDFSGLTINGAQSYGSYVSPSTTPYSSSFPGSTVAMDDGGGSYSYYTQNSSGISYNGNSNGLSPLIYSDPEILLKFPFVYGNTNIDNFSASSSGGYTHTGTMSINADGYGTISLPSGTFNTLRLKTIETYTDVMSPYTFYSTVTIYNWYTATERFPILQYYIATRSGSSTAYFKGITINANVVGIEESLKDNSFLNVFPNPAVNSCTLNYVLEVPANVSITVNDILGRELMNQNKGIQSAGIQSEIIDLDNFASGMYMIKITYGNKVSFKKIQIN